MFVSLGLVVFLVECQKGDPRDIGVIWGDSPIKNNCKALDSHIYGLLNKKLPSVSLLVAREL